MRNRPIHTLVSLAALAVLCVGFGGCEKKGKTAESSGRGHAVAESPGGKDESRPAGERFCTEHRLPEAECGICHPELMAKLKPGESLKVRLPSVESTRIIDVQTAAPEIGTIADGIECFAEISFDQNALAQIIAPVTGIIQSVDVDLGGKVQEKQTVAQLWSASIAEAVAKAVLTHQTLDRERRLRADQVTSEAALQEAEATHNAACQQLRTLGFTEGQIDELGHKPQEQVLMKVWAPFAGEIIERTAVHGALVEMGKPLFTLVDRSVMWAMLQVPETALAHVQAG